jgi:hypothetical protein
LFERLRRNAFSERDYGLIIPFGAVVVYFVCLRAVSRDWSQLPGSVLLLSSPLLPAIFYNRYAALVVSWFFCLVLGAAIVDQLFYGGLCLLRVAPLVIYGWPTAVIVARWLRARKRTHLSPSRM